MQGYEEIFAKRGRSYHQAMDLFPKARNEEFEAGVRFLKQKKNAVILDIPAGGGYLRRFLNPNCSYLAYDFSGEFDDNHTGITRCKESNINLKDDSVDEIISLAAHHHIVDRVGFYTEMHRILRPTGRFVIADVVSGSKIDGFLNGFLDNWNSMGHQGLFINPDSDTLILNQSGFRVVFEVQAFHWNFNSLGNALEFFRKLFYLDRNPSDELLLNEFNKLGISESENAFRVRWSLGFLIAEKR